MKGLQNISVCCYLETRSNTWKRGFPLNHPPKIRNVLTQKGIFPWWKVSKNISVCFQRFLMPCWHWRMCKIFLLWSKFLVGKPFYVLLSPDTWVPKKIKSFWLDPLLPRALFVSSRPICQPWPESSRFQQCQEQKINRFPKLLVVYCCNSGFSDNYSRGSNEGVDWGRRPQRLFAASKSKGSRSAHVFFLCSCTSDFKARCQMDPLAQAAWGGSHKLTAPRGV
jgi:hypothetical protein